MDYCLQVSKAAFRPRLLAEARRRVRARAGGNTGREPRPQPPLGATEAAQPAYRKRKAAEWSEEEQFVRTGSFSVMDNEDWRPSELGGSAFKRQLNNCLADDHILSNRTAACNKRQRCTKKLVPGCMVFWCAQCRKCKVRLP